METQNSPSLIAQFHQSSLLISALTTKWIFLWSKTINPALSQERLLSTSLPVKASQVFDAFLTAVPSTASAVSWWCWLAITVGQSSCCLRCAPCASVCRDSVTGLSPLMLTHLKKWIKKSWRALQLLRMPSCRTETHTWKTFNFKKTFHSKFAQ